MMCLIKVLIKKMLTHLFFMKGLHLQMGSQGFIMLWQEQLKIFSVDTRRLKVIM